MADRLHLIRIMESKPLTLAELATRQAAREFDGRVTEMGRAVFVAMLSDDAAQARYLAIYGEPFFKDGE